MKKLRKDNGGYALVYVLIVVLVLCAVAVSVCTAALKNYQAQEESIRQTQQLYQAEGEIEKFVALAEEVNGLSYSAEFTAEGAAKDAAKDAYVNYVTSLSSGCTLIGGGIEACEFEITCANEAVEIESTIEMALTYDVQEREEKIPRGDGTYVIENYYSAKVSKVAHSYNTYTITHLTS